MTEHSELPEAPDAVDEISIEDLTDEAGAGTTNCGGTFGTASCPATVGTAFSFT